MDQLLKALLGFSLMLFSTYKGNDPKFDDFSYLYDGKNLTIAITLKDAFINDFKPIIKSTEPLFLNYIVKITNQSGKTIFSRTYQYSIVFDPFLQRFTLNRSSQAILQKAYKDAINLLSSFETNITLNKLELLYVEIKAYPQKMNLNGKAVDLKLLWKNKIPYFKSRVIPRIYEH